MPPLREAKLRADAAARYPGLPIGEWLPAARLASECRVSGIDPAPGTRVLADSAFDFRGGAPELVLRPRARTRWEDSTRVVPERPRARRSSSYQRF
jgi:hypothetical protein